MSDRITIDYFSDILCVWAYAAQIRLDQLRRDFGDQIEIRCHYIPVFGDTAAKIASGWADRGGFQGYSEHIHEVGRQFDFITIHPRLWRDTRPPSSLGCHLFLKAVELQQACGTVSDRPLPDCAQRTLLEETAWQMRLAFFRDARNVAQLDEQFRIASQLDLPVDAIRRSLEDGSAHAALSHDFELREKHLIQGSPTFMLNEGRQKLYGNVGYRIIEANIQELLEHPHDQASWC